MSIKFMKINKYEPAADEKKLEEMAANGEFIKSHVLGMAFFKKKEPKKVKYCIEAAMFRPSRKMRKAYAESGWKMAARGEDFTVYMSEGENTVPLHTDRSEYAHIIQRFHRTAMWLMIYMFIMSFLLIICPFFLIQFMEWGLLASMVSNLWDTGLAYACLRSNLMWFIIFVPLIALYLRDYTEAGKFIAGSIENGKSADKAVWYSNAAKVIFIVLIIMGTMAHGIFIWSAYVAESVEKQKLEEVPLQAITLDEIFGAEHIVYLETDELADKYIDPEDKEDLRKGIKPKIEEITSAIFNHYAYWQPAAYIPEGEEYGDRILLEGTYTDFKNEWFAKQGAKEFMQYATFYLPSDEVTTAIPVDVAGTEFENAEYIIDEEDRYYFVLRDGKVVYTLVIYLSDNLDTTPEEIFNGIHK